MWQISYPLQMVRVWAVYWVKMLLFRPSAPALQATFWTNNTTFQTKIHLSNLDRRGYTHLEGEVKSFLALNQWFVPKHKIKTWTAECFTFFHPWNPFNPHWCSSIASAERRFSDCFNHRFKCLAWVMSFKF